MLRTLLKSDLDQVLTIEQAVHVVPWNRETFQICFESGYLGWVIEQNKKVIGFIFVSLHVEECHILNVCIARDFQQQGWGKKLLEHALAYAKKEGAGVAYLEVRRSNQRAISLYRKMKFHMVGERKNYYQTVSGYEDALVFAISLKPTLFI